MKKYVFLLKGRRDRDLYTSDGVKVYFPDRYNREELTVGIAECSVSNNFDKYGFILGHMAENVGTLRDALDAGKVNLSNVIGLRHIKGYEYWVERRGAVRYYCAFIDGDVFDFTSEDDFDLPSKQRYNINDFYWNLISQSNDLTDVLDCIRSKYMDNIVSNIVRSDRKSLIWGIIRTLTSCFPESVRLYGGKVISIEMMKGYPSYYYFDDELVSIPKCDLEGLSVEDLTDKIKNTILDYNLVISSCDGIVTRKLSCFNTSIEVCFLSTKSFTSSDYETYRDTLEKSKTELNDFKKYVGKYITKNNISELQKLSTKDWQLGKCL